jgi:hypothetical protein
LRDSFANPLIIPQSRESALMKATMSGAQKSNAGTLRVALSVAILSCASAAAAQEQQKLFIEGDIVRGNTPSGNTGPVCVLANQFKRKENVIFRIRVRNAMGQPLDDKGLKSLVVELSDGKKIPAEYRARPPVAVRARLGLTGPIDYFWSSAWLSRRTTRPGRSPTGWSRPTCRATRKAGSQ